MRTPLNIIAGFLIGFISFQSSPEEHLDYSITDPNPGNGNNYYRIVRVDSNSNQTSSKVILVQYSETALRLINNRAKRLRSTATNQAAIMEPAADIKTGAIPTANSLNVFLGNLPKNLQMKVSVLSITGSLLKSISSNTSVSKLDICSRSSYRSLQNRIEWGDTCVTRQFIKQ